MKVTVLTRQHSERSFKSFFPILDWLSNYKLSFLRPDIVAGITVCALLVPEAMAYAGILECLQW